MTNEVFNKMYYDNSLLIEDVLLEFKLGILHFMSNKDLTHKESWIFKRGYEFASSNEERITI